MQTTLNVIRGFITCILFCQIAFIHAQQTLNLGSDYTHYKIIRNKWNSKVLDQFIGGNYNGNVEGAGFHGRNNQQWVVMPLWVKAKSGKLTVSKDYIIASRKNGKVLDVDQGKYNVYCFPRFEGLDNQLFHLNTNGDTEIYSKFNKIKVLDQVQRDSFFNLDPWRFPNNYEENFYMQNRHDRSNQQFTVSTISKIPNAPTTIRSTGTVEIPLPPQPTSLTSIVPTETASTFVSETFVPFPLVKNDWSPSRQVENSPYYKLVRSQFYRLAPIQGDVRYINGVQRSIQTKIKVGVNSTRAREIERKLNVGFTKRLEVAGPPNDLTDNVKTIFKTAFELDEKEIESLDQTYAKNEIVESNYNGGEDARILHYQLIDDYKLYRTDGSLALFWEVSSNTVKILTYPANIIVSIGDKGEDKDLINNKTTMLPLKENLVESSSHTNPSALSIETFNGNDQITISSTKSLIGDGTVELYNVKASQVRKFENITLPFNFSTIGLEKGLYILKIYNEEEVVTKKIVIP